VIPEPLIYTHEVNEFFPGLMNRRALRLGRFGIVQDGKTKLVLPRQPSQFWHTPNSYDAKCAGHRIGLGSLFRGWEDAEVLEQLTTMFKRHVLPDPHKRRDFALLNVDSTNADRFMASMYDHAKRAGTLVLLHNPRDRAIWKAGGKHDPAKKSYNFALEIPPNWVMGSPAEADPNTQRRHLFFTLARYDHLLPIYEGRLPDPNEIKARGLELLEMVEKHCRLRDDETGKNRRLREDATKYLRFLQRLKEGHGRLCDSTLIALGLQPNVDLTKFPVGGSLFQDVDYNCFSDAELLVGIFHHFRVVDDTNTLVGNTIYIAPRLKGPLAAMYHLTKTYAEFNRVKPSRALGLLERCIPNSPMLLPPPSL
jgi:hypothetical protein